MKDLKGKFPEIRNDKDGLAVDMKLKGRNNDEIAEATGLAKKTVQNSLTKGGRLYPVVEALRSQKVQMLQEHAGSSWERLLEAKDPSIDELKRIAREDPNPAARLKAIDMVLDLTGVREGSKPPLLDPGNLQESCDKFRQWADDLLLKTFREKAPQINLMPREVVSEDRGITVHTYVVAKFVIWRYCHFFYDKPDSLLSSMGFDVEKEEEFLMRHYRTSNPWEILSEDRYDAKKNSKYQERIEAMHKKTSQSWGLAMKCGRKYVYRLAESLLETGNLRYERIIKRYMANMFLIKDEIVDEFISDVKRVRDDYLSMCGESKTAA